MEEIAISKFKATCLAVLEQVRVTGKPILVTRFGKPVAEVAPPAERKNKKRVLGGMPGRIVGDLKESLFTAEDTVRWGEDRTR
jgi:prevent-host-death family protein